MKYEKSIALAIVVIAVVVAGSRFVSKTSSYNEPCSHNGHDHTSHDHGHCGHDHGDHGLQKSSQITVWDDRFEIFMEYPFIVANTPTEFITHVTDRVAFKPLLEGTVTFALTDESETSIKHVEKAPVRDGIYIPKLTFPHPGNWTASLIIAVEGDEHIIELSGIMVYSSQKEVEHAPAPEEIVGISFLKEQQWKIPFETKAVHRERINSQMVLAVPTSAIVDKEKNPTVFVQLAGETFQKRYVTLGQEEYGSIQVVSGVSEGEYIVAQGVQSIAKANHDHDDHHHTDHTGHDH